MWLDLNTISEVKQSGNKTLIRKKIKEITIERMEAVTNKKAFLFYRKAFVTLNQITC